MLYACILAACFGQDSRCSSPVAVPSGPHRPPLQPDGHLLRQQRHLCHHMCRSKAFTCTPRRLRLQQLWREGEREGWRDTGMLLPDVRCAA